MLYSRFSRRKVIVIKKIPIEDYQAKLENVICRKRSNGTVLFFVISRQRQSVVFQ